MTSEIESKNWHHGEFLISTEKRLLQVDAVHKAMDSDLIYWTQAPPMDVLRQALDNSFCLGLYQLPQSAPEIAGQDDAKQIGLVRMVTDGVTFGYLTDVYVLSEHQGKGLGRWLMACLDEVIKGWPYLRRLMFLTNSSSLDMYKKTLGASDWEERENQDLVIGLVRGPAAPAALR